MCSDCNGNNTGDFRGNSLAVHRKAYNELFVAIYVANICTHVLISSTIGKASGIIIVSWQPKTMDYS